MLKNYKNKKLKKSAKITPKMLLKPEKEKDKEKPRVNLKERVEENICDLSLSGLNEVPVRGIASCKRVTVLDLSSNNLTILSRNFCLLLTRLVGLNLSQNQLRSLPDEFGALHNLQHLDLYDNKLQYLPLSFGNLVNLRYLDLTGNPLAPAFSKVVGTNATTKDCQESARNTVAFISKMQSESKRFIKDVGDFVYEAIEAELKEINAWEDDEKEEEREKMLVIPIPRSKKKLRNKQKKKAPAQIATRVNKDNLTEISTTITTTSMKQNAQLRNMEHLNNASPLPNRKFQRGRKKSVNKFNFSRFIKRYISSTVIRSILTFFLLLAVNIFVIYMIMFKNPDLADKIVEAIPQQYRVWIQAKTEIFRVNIGDWISDFLTPPDEQ